ncbi:DUF6069 family protein [Streptomyces sp. ODS28]|uniref:DUF6069 family protein n=1 Tax=Streptomyces sp. ODS28 TaxID=3136688 RepID=UPI0031F0AC6C
MDGQPYRQSYGQQYNQGQGQGRDPYGQGPYGDDPYGYGPYGRDPYGRGPRRRVAAGRLWAGGVMTAVVAALASFVALMLVRGVLHIPVFAPQKHGTLVPATSGTLAAGAAAAALVATLVLHLLMVSTPQPERFFGWIVGLATVAVMLLPFTSYTSWPSKIGTAAVYLVIGLVIGSLLTAVGRGASDDGGYYD